MMAYHGDLPPERDLPAGVRQQMRSSVLRTVAAPVAGRSARSGRHRRLVLATAGLVVLAAAATTLATVDRPDLPGHQRPEIFALGDEALPQVVRDAGNLCLTHAHQVEGDRWPADARPVMVNSASRDDRAAVVYRIDTKMIICSMEPTNPRSDELSSSFQLVEQQSAAPEPVTVLATVSSERDSGLVMVIGRVGQRVARLVLTGEAGAVAEASIAGGTFAVVSAVEVDLGTSTLVAYDNAGTEIDRRPAFTGIPGPRAAGSPQASALRCVRTDPAGTVGPDQPGSGCRPEPSST